MWTHFFYYILALRFYLNLSVNLATHFSSFADFRQLQIPNAQTKQYEILPAHNKIPRDTTCKIANRYVEFKYNFLTLQKNSDNFGTGLYIIDIDILCNQKSKYDMSISSIFTPYKAAE